MVRLVKAMVFPVIMYGCESWIIKKAEQQRILVCGVGEDSWESLGLQGDPAIQSWRKSVLHIHWKDWCCSSNTSATWCEKLIHWKRPYAGKDWSRRKRGPQRMRWLDGITESMDMSLSKLWRWWRTGKIGVLQSLGLQRDTTEWLSNVEPLDESIWYIFLEHQVN